MVRTKMSWNIKGASPFAERRAKGAEVKHSAEIELCKHCTKEVCKGNCEEVKAARRRR